MTRTAALVMSLSAALAVAQATATPAAAQTDAQRILDRIRTGRTGPAAVPVQLPGQPPVAPLSVVPPTGEKGIAEAPMPVTLKKWMGQDRTFGIFPNRIFVAGYNIGALRKIAAEGKARGGIMNTNQGASSKSEMIAHGITDAMLTRIADAALGDLIFQLKAAGFDVVSIDAAKAAEGADKLGFNTPPYSATGNDILVVGPTPTGVRNNTPLGKTEFGSFGAPVLSVSLESMVVMPNLAFDFGWASGNRSWGFTATSQTGVRFGINTAHSRMRVFASKRRQFLEGDFIFSPDGEPVSDAPFASIGDTVNTDNSDFQRMNASLGLAVQARSKETSYLAIDQRRYEALALSAARGWNTAFVNALRARTGR